MDVLRAQEAKISMDDKIAQLEREVGMGVTAISSIIRRLDDLDRAVLQGDWGGYYETYRRPLIARLDALRVRIGRRAPQRDDEVWTRPAPQLQRIAHQQPAAPQQPTTMMQSIFAPRRAGPQQHLQPIRAMPTGQAISSVAPQVQGGNLSIPRPIQPPPEYQVVLQEHGDYGAKECTICLDGFEADEEQGFTICGHRFHGPCIRTWARVKRVGTHVPCPLCQRNVLILQVPNAEKKDNCKEKAETKSGGSEEPEVKVNTETQQVDARASSESKEGAFDREQKSEVEEAEAKQTRQSGDGQATEAGHGAAVGSAPLTSLLPAAGLAEGDPRVEQLMQMGFARELSQIALAQCGGQMDEAVTFCVNNANARVQEFQESWHGLQQQEDGGSGGGELLAPAENKEGPLEPANSEIKGPTSRSHRLSSASKLAELEPLHCGSSVLGIAKAEDGIEAGASAPATAKTEDDTGAGASCPGKATSAEPFAEPKSTDSNILEAKVSHSDENGFRPESPQLRHIASSSDVQLQDQKSVSSQGSKGQSQSNTCILC